MPKVYITDRGIASVLTGTTAVHELPSQLRIVSGITPPAAGAGSKQLSGKARVRMEIVSVLHHKRLSASLANKITAVRCSLAINGIEGITLDGVLTNRITTTCDLYIEPRLVYMSGTLTNTMSASAELFIPGRIEGVVRNRMVGNLAVLTTGTTHQPTALLPVKWGAGAVLTLNYMQARLVVPWSAWCILDVHVKLAGSTGLKQTASLDLTRGPGTGGGTLSVRWTGTARLTMPLRAAAALRMSASLVADAQRRLTGSTIERFSAPASLSVVRTFGVLLGARQTASATLTSVRAVAGQARMTSTALASLTSDRHLGGFAPVRWRADLAMQPVRPVQGPVADITVTPDMPAIESEPLPVQVESPSGTVHVEDS